MAVRLDILVSFPELGKLKLVGGGSGIYRFVRWVHIVESPDVLEYVQNDELVILTGIVLYQDEAKFVELIYGLIEKKAAGLIVNIGKYFEKIPQQIIRIGNENDFPIFELPWEVSLADITKIICENIVKKNLEELSYQDLLLNVIFFNNISLEGFAQRLSAYGYSTLNSFRILIITIDQLQQYTDAKQIGSEHDIAHMKEIFLRSVNSATTDTRHQPVSFLRNDSVVLLIINEKDRYMNLELSAQIIREIIRKNLPDVNVNIGIGNAYTEFSNIKTSYAEAEKALMAIKAEGLSGWTEFYSDIGMYKLIMEIGDMGRMKDYYDETVGKLAQYDKHNGTDYAKVLYVFLTENGNYIQTSERLYLHRNTLVYKIKKIQEIIGHDVADMRVRFEYYAGYLIAKINDF